MFANADSFLEICCGSALVTTEISELSFNAVGIDRIHGNFRPIGAHIYMDIRSYLTEILCLPLLIRAVLHLFGFRSHRPRYYRTCARLAVNVRTPDAVYCTNLTVVDKCLGDRIENVNNVLRSAAAVFHACFDSCIPCII